MTAVLAFLTAHWGAILSVVLALLPTIITGLGAFPTLAKVLGWLFDMLSVAAHKDAQGSLKLPLTTSKFPPAGTPGA